MKFDECISEMEDAVLFELSKLDPGFMQYKWSISEETGIPEDVLTVILRRLKYEGKIRLEGTFCEWNGMASGSGYRLTGK